MPSLADAGKAFLRSFGDRDDRMAALAVADGRAWPVDELRMVQRHGITNEGRKR